MIKPLYFFDVSLNLKSMKNISYDFFNNVKRNRA